MELFWKRKQEKVKERTGTNRCCDTQIQVGRNTFSAFVLLILYKPELKSDCEPAKK
jgi:hypothetical protein